MSRIEDQGRYADELRSKRAALGPREGREARFVLLDHDKNEVPKDKIEELVKSGKLKAQDLTRVHLADLPHFLKDR